MVAGQLSRSWHSDEVAYRAVWAHICADVDIRLGHAAEYLLFAGVRTGFKGT